MSELEECPGDVVWHVEGDGAFGVVPANVDATEKQAVPVHGECVVFLECCLEMRDVIAQGGLYAKVVHDEAKHNVMPDVFFSWVSPPVSHTYHTHNLQHT